MDREGEPKPGLLGGVSKPLPCPELGGLVPPTLNSGEPVTGANKEKHRLENKRRRVAKQLQQRETSYWADHHGQFRIPTPKQGPRKYRGDMCPKGLALEHPAARHLLEYATGGCPSKTGRNWNRQMIEEAIAVGPHVTSMEPEPMAVLAEEVVEKEKMGQCRVVDWEDIKHDIPPQLKISRVAMVPHKSRKFRAILDLSFVIGLKGGGTIPSVNETSEKTASRGAIDQMGHSLMRVIHAFAQADPDAKLFVKKGKNGILRMYSRSHRGLQ